MDDDATCQRQYQRQRPRQARLPPSDQRCLTAVSVGEAMNPSRRCTMEDAILVLEAGTGMWGNSSSGGNGSNNSGRSSTATNDYNLLAVYDGHGGRDMVDFVRHALHHHLAAEIEHLQQQQAAAAGEVRTANKLTNEDDFAGGKGSVEDSDNDFNEHDDIESNRSGSSGNTRGGCTLSSSHPSATASVVNYETDDDEEEREEDGSTAKRMPTTTKIDLALALERAFLVTDIHARAAGITSSGVTVAMALVKRLLDGRVEIVAANAGDARIVLCTRRPTNTTTTTTQPQQQAAFSPLVAIRLTSDHNCANESERLRINRSGGFVWKGRVAGVLAVTRSLGDQGLKQLVIAHPHICTATTATPRNCSQPQEQSLLSGQPKEGALEAAGDKENRATSSATGVGAAVPAVATASTVKNSSTSTEQEPTSAAASSSSPLGDFLIVGCDGLWDVVDDQTAANFVWEQLRRGVAPAAVAPLLVQEALRRGTTDNVSVIVAFL